MLRKNRRFLIGALVALALVVGCSDGSSTITTSDDPLSPSRMAEIALQSDLTADEALASELGAALNFPQMDGGDGGSGGIITHDASFSASRQCPGGGEMSIDGMIHITIDRDNGILEAEVEGGRTRTDCVFGRGDNAVTVNGFDRMESFRRMVRGRLDGLQTTRYYGSWSAVRSDGEQRSCDHDVTIVRDPDTRTRTVDGVICGTEVHHSVSWGMGG